MDKIIPRWEWRTFGESFGEADARYAGLTPTDVQESDELYFLSNATDENVKVRFDLMDIKALEQVNADGLEQWKPVMKASFPLPAAEAKKVLGALGVSARSFGREELHARPVCERARRAGRITFRPGAQETRALQGQRLHVRDDGCRCRRAQNAHRRTRTGRCGPRHRYGTRAGPRPLFQYQLSARSQAAAGHERSRVTIMPRYAVIDVGTNSVKFNISERRPDGSWQTVVDRADITRLGEGLEKTGEINPDAMERTVSAVAAMVSEARDAGVAAIAAVGTMGMRAARNSQQFIDMVEQRCGVRIEVIPGQEEGRLAYLAVKAGLGLAEGSLVIFDTGGGSTQFTFGHGVTVKEQFSLNVGAVRFTEKYGLAGAISLEQLKLAQEAIAAEFTRIDGRPSPDALVGMGGAITNIAAVKHGLAKYDPDVIQGSVIERSEVERQIELYRSKSTEERRAIVGLQPKRADVILAGACIVKIVMDKLGKDKLSVSDRGLRHGLLIDRFSN